MDFFKSIAIFIGWLTSSLAGIAAIFYACGYLVTRAQLNLLGLFGLFEYPNAHYLQEGAKFIITITVISIASIIPELVVLGYLILFFMLFLTPMLIFFAKKRPEYKDFLINRISYLAEQIRRWSWLWRGFIFCILLFFLVFYLTDYLNQFTVTLNVSNLLYGDPGQSNEQDETRKLIDWITSGNQAELQNYFSSLLVGELLVTLVLALAWQITVPWRIRFWLALPFLIIFAMYTLFTPMVYGVLVRPIKYAVIEFQSDNKTLLNSTGDFFLLNKTIRDFVLWDSLEKKVLWIPIDEVSAAQVKEVRPLFENRSEISE